MYIGLFWLTLRPVMGCCESGNELPGYIKETRDYYVLKNDSAA